MMVIIFCKKKFIKTLKNQVISMPLFPNAMLKMVRSITKIFHNGTIILFSTLAFSGSLINIVLQFCT